MKTIKQIGAVAMLVALFGRLTACGDMITRQRDTAVGAAVSGIIGNQVGK